MHYLKGFDLCLRPLQEILNEYKTKINDLKQKITFFHKLKPWNTCISNVKRM